MEYHDWFSCPVCGTEVKLTARVCPECGADDETGWKDEYDRAHGQYGGEDDFDYDEFLENGFGKKTRLKRNGWQSAYLSRVQNHKS